MGTRLLLILCIILIGCISTLKGVDIVDDPSNKWMQTTGQPPKKSTIVDLIDNSTGENDTMGIYLRPEYSVYSTKVTKINFFLHNRSGKSVICDGDYSITYISGLDIWRRLSLCNETVNTVYKVPHNESATFTANLNPDVNDNKAGIYRYFHNIKIGNRKLRMMTVFKLSNDKQDLENAWKTTVPEKYEKDFPPVEERVYYMVKEMPQLPGGAEELKKYVYNELPKGINKKGNVVVHFVVEKDGRLSYIEVVHSQNKALNEEAIRIVKRMPRWLPGKIVVQNEKMKYTPQWTPEKMIKHPVRVHRTILIHFKKKTG